MALARAARAWAARYPGRYAALQVAPAPEDADGQAAAGELVKVIAAALRAYRLEGDALTDAIRLIRATLHGFIVLEQGGGFRQARSVEASYARIITALHTVLAGWRA